MSDPLSVAGTAVGITSLGIQVCQGLITYLRVVRGRKEEVREIIREVDQVVSLLYSLHNTLPNVGIRNGTNSLRTCVNNCYTKLEELGKFLDDLSESQHPQKVVKRATDIVRGMSYPFQQEKLNTMRQSLRSILGDLGLVISIISMDSDSSIKNTVNDISQDVKDNAASHLAYSKDLQTQMHCNSFQLRTLQTTISKTLSNIHEQLHQTQLSIQDLGQQINGTMTVFETGQRSIEANTQVTAAKMDELIQAMQSHSVLLQSMGMRAHTAHPLQDTDAATTYQHTEVAVARSDMSLDKMRPRRGCYCRSAVPESTTSFKFWNLQFLFEEQEHHLPSCKLRGTTKGTRRRAKAEFLLNLSWFSARMTRASFEYASGTSRPGLSIRCRNTVRRIDSPVFTVIENFVFKYSRSRVVTPSETVLDLEALEREILTLYSHNRASPFDTDEYGYTHAEMLCIWLVSRFMLVHTRLLNERLVYALTSCLGTLLQANDCDPGVLSIARFLIRNTDFATSEYNITKCLISSLYETSYFPFTDMMLLEVAKIKPSAPFTSIIHGALDLSPVVKAILSRNFEDLVSCVRQAPESVLECVFGVDALLLSVAWPKGLKYLLTTKAKTLLSLDDKEYRGTHILRAFEFGPAESVHLLLQAGCYVPYEEHINYIPREAARVTAKHIAKRRLQLLKSAQTQLGLFIGQESVAFADFAAAKICDAFDTANIPITPCLRVKPSYKSIYLNRDIPFDAFKYFWRKGFCHFDCHDSVGRTPIMATNFRCTHYGPKRSFEHTIEILPWLRKHGFMQGKAKDPLSLGFNIFSDGYHHMGAWLAFYLNTYHCRHAKTAPIVRFLAEIPDKLKSEDNCTCWCNDGGRGCSPIKLFLKTLSLCQEAGFRGMLDNILKCQMFHAVGSDELSALAKDYLRLITFEALDMTHTCCYFDPIGEHDPCNLVSEDLYDDWAIFCRDSESVLEIRSSTEEQTSAVLLEELMIEFIPQLQLFNPSPLAFKGFISTYFRRRISELYSQYPPVVDHLRQHQVFQGFGASPPLEARILPESVHRLLGEDFELLGPNESISEEECLAEVSEYVGKQCEECLSYEESEGSTSESDYSESDQSDEDRDTD